MAKKPAKKRSFGWFLLGMLIYAVVFLGATAYGLKYFWNFIAAYEDSRPKYAVEAYMDQLTEDYIFDHAVNTADEVDHNIQPLEQCLTYIRNNVPGEISYAKKSNESTQDRQVFVIRKGTTVVGQFSIVTGEADDFGFKRWKFQQDSFDLSFIRPGEEQTSVTVPSEVTVVVNGVELDDSYITQRDIHYPEIEDYYGDYPMPTKVTYTFGPFLGDVEVKAVEADGSELDLNSEIDYRRFYLNTTPEEIAALDELTEQFVQRYVTFTGSANRARQENYNNLMAYVVPGSDLASRMQEAIEGLYFAQSKGDKVASITPNLMLRIDDGKYLCDITYEVDTTGFNGVVRTTTDAKLTVVQTANGLKVESMRIY